MGKIAFVFAGQGAQYSGMGQSLCEMSPAAQRLVVVCRQGVFFFKLNSVFTEIGADILLDSFCQLVAKEGQCPLPLLGQAVAGVVVHGLGGNHIRVFQIA